MTERIRSGATAYQQSNKMPDLGPRKSLFVLVIVVGCFAVLWPKVFYPMLVGSAQQHMKPSDIDKATGCCDVISDADVDTIKIMSELCKSIIEREGEKSLSGKEIVAQCRVAVLKTCGIDISAVLQEQVRLGATVKQILEEIRSLNGSLCLKYNFGVSPWKLGVPHRITVRVESVKQERPLHLKSELVHPAFRERGRAIPNVQRTSSKANTPPKIVEGRPGPIPGMRPPMGGAGHVVPPSTKGTSSMSIIMPVYTIGIVIFFTYTLMKLLFKKQPDSVASSLYPPVEPDREFRKEVFESEKSQLTSRYSRDGVSSKLVVNAMSALLDEVDQELESRRKALEVAEQDEHTLANGNINSGKAEQDQTSVKVLGMEMTASCEDGQKWNRPDSPVKPTVPMTPTPEEPPQEIYLEGALPAQSKILVADSATETQPNEMASDPAVVLAGKMTLSVISLDSNEEGENGHDEIDESKYTTVSNATAAEKDISDEEENTDNRDEDIQNEEVLIADNREDDILTNNFNGIDPHQDKSSEVELAAREFIEQELKAALEEVAPLKNELQDVEELLYDQIRKEEQAELKAVLERNDSNIRRNDEVGVPENLEQQIADILDDIPNQGICIKSKEEIVAQEQQAEVFDELLKQETYVEHEEEAVEEEQHAIISDETVPKEQAEISNELSKPETNEEEKKEEIVVEEQKAEILNEVSKQETYIEHEEEIVPEEQKAEVALFNQKENFEISDRLSEQEEIKTIESEKENAEIPDDPKELTNENQQTIHNLEDQAIDLNNFDSDEYEIEEYEVEVDEDEDIGDEIIVVDEDDRPLHRNANVPKE